tara:strand:+ start:245 stop:793 length:549 start_codon:yes stop_codon:yes gene_type:complete
MSIYEQMEEYLLSKYEVGEKIPLPQRVQDYLSMRREAVSNAMMRGKDSPDHLSWKHYATVLDAQTDIPDLVAWELFYTDMNAPPCVLHAYELRMSADPARPYVKVGGIKPMLDDGKTTPEFIALASEFAEKMDWDIMELNPPALSISLEDISQVESLMQALGVEGDPLSFMQTDTGEDVTLA